MKINWGTSVVLAFVFFIVFILFFVVKTFTQEAYEYDLVSSHYYEDELEFQKNINNAQNTYLLEKSVTIVKKNEELEITIPNINDEVLVGDIHFYRPSNEKLDFTLNINSKQNVFRISDERLVKGRWNVSISWYYMSNNSKVFYKKEQLYF